MNGAIMLLKYSIPSASWTACFNQREHSLFKFCSCELKVDLNNSLSHWTRTQRAPLEEMTLQQQKNTIWLMKTHLCVCFSTLMRLHHRYLPRSAKLATEGYHMGICGYHRDSRNGHRQKNVLASIFTNPFFVIQTFFKIHFSPPCLRLHKNTAR